MLDGDDGFGRRKLVQRTAAERAAIVAETYAPGATVAGVAARHGIQPSQLSAWRSAARKKVARTGAVAEQPLGFAEVAVVPERVPLIETCKLNNVEPYAYLKATLEAIATGHPVARIDELMPWNFDKKS